MQHLAPRDHASAERDNKLHLVPRFIFYQVQAFSPGWCSFEDVEKTNCAHYRGRYTSVIPHGDVLSLSVISLLLPDWSVQNQATSITPPGITSLCTHATQYYQRSAMAKVLSSRTSALPYCILPRVMGLVSCITLRHAVLRRCKTHEPLENTTWSGWYAGRYNFIHGIFYK